MLTEQKFLSLHFIMFMWSFLRNTKQAYLAVFQYKNMFKTHSKKEKYFYIKSVVGENNFFLLV